MKRKNVIWWLLPFSALTVGCGSGTVTAHTIPSNDSTLVVDLHTWMPTGSSSSADLVSITATQDIADDFKKATGITIKWFTGKTLSGESAEASADYIKAIQNGTMPAIGFSWSAFTDRGYYLDLSDYLATPNEFLSADEQAQYPTWKDQFPSYLWKNYSDIDGKGNPIAIPLVLNPGPATGWFYNKTAFEQQGYDVPTSWQKFKSLAGEIQSNTAGPFPYKQTAELTNWAFRFSIGPVFANLLSPLTDLDGDGNVTQNETYQAVGKGYFSPLKSENPDHYQLAQAAYQMIKDFYKNVLPDNWKTASSATCWANGQAMLRENGLWSVRAEKGLDNTRSWKYGVFPAPLVGKDSASFLTGKGLSSAASALKDPDKVQLDSAKTYTTLARAEQFVKLYQPDPSLYLNLMYNGIYDNKTVLANAVKFLKFLSTPENVSRLAVDHQGVLGGVYGATPGTTLNEWLMQAFPFIPTSQWPVASSVANQVSVNQAFAKWVSGGLTDDEFYQNVASLQKKDAEDYIAGLSK
jgi:raffinose/stachyose/melibiose transport system substrate-binding protein